MYSRRKVKPVKEFLFSSKKFSELVDLHPHLIACLKDRLKVEEMTKIQQATIPHLMQDHDCLIKSATGSGKTLAYLIPIVQKLQAIQPKLTRKDGVFCLIIVPTRELVAQCFNVASTLCKVSGRACQDLDDQHVFFTVFYLARSRMFDGWRKEKIREK